MDEGINNKISLVRKLILFQVNRDQFRFKRFTNSRDIHNYIQLRFAISGTERGKKMQLR